MIGRLPIVGVLLLAGCYCSHRAALDAGPPGDAELADSATAADAAADAADAGPPLPPLSWSVRPTQLDISDRHACAVLEDGRVACWGSSRISVLGPDTTDGCARGALSSSEIADDFVLQPTFVPGVANAVEVAVGQVSSCARTASGDVWCWGRQDDDRCRYRAAHRLDGLEDVVQIQGTSINQGFCAIHGDGGVSCWAFDRAPRRIAGLVDVDAISVGGWGACAIVGRDLVRCFAHALPDGDFVEYPVENAREISAVGSDSFCVLEGEGSVRCWGSGRQPFGETSGDEPRVVPGLAASTGLDMDSFESACAWTADGSVFCWGENERGQLGDGTAVFRDRPVRVLGIDDALQVAVGQDAACAIRRSGGIACWGTGWLGNGEALHHYDAVLVPEVVNAARLSLRDSESCALTPDGRAQCWGVGNFAPPQERGLSLAELSVRGPIRNACGRWCVALEDGTVQCPVGEDFRTGFVDLREVSALTCGRQHDCAVVSGAVRCSGVGDRGELGDGGGGPIRLGDEITFADEIVEIAAGDNHTCARSLTGDVYCWGANRSGQAGATASEAQLTPVLVASGADRISVGGNTSCLVRGDAWSCWGRLSTIDALCDSPCDVPFESAVEVRMPFAAEQLRLSSGLNCVMPSAGAVRCTGHPSRIGSRPAGTTSAVLEVDGTEASVDLGVTRDHACALAEDGRVRCWGFNGAGQLGGINVGSHSIPVGVRSPE